MLKPKLISFILLVLLVAAQCQLSEQPTVEPAVQATAIPPTPVLIPPIQPGDGSDLIDRLLANGVIRVGIRVWPEALFSPPAFRGFSNAATGGAMNGFEVDIARLIAEGLGLELELVETYPPVIATGDWRGQWDIALASLVPFDQDQEANSEHGLAFSQAYGYMPMGILVVAEENRIQSFNDLAGKRVGVLEHSAYQRLLTPEDQPLTVQEQSLLPRMPAEMQLIVLSNIAKAIRELGQPEADPVVDAILGPAPLLQEAVKSEFPVKLAPRATNIGLQPLAIAVVPQDDLKTERLITEINKILDRLEHQGALSEVYLRWYGQDLSSRKSAEALK